MSDCYTVKYMIPGQLLFRTVKSVTGDGIVTHLNSGGTSVPLPEPYRYLVIKGGGMIHLPYNSVVVFGPEREVLIARNMSKVSGQPVTVDI